MAQRKTACKKTDITGSFKECGNIPVDIEKAEGLVLFLHQELGKCKNGDMEYRLLLWEPPSGLVVQIEKNGKQVAEYRVRFDSLVSAIAGFHKGRG